MPSMAVVNKKNKKSFALFITASKIAVNRQGRSDG